MTRRTFLFAGSSALLLGGRADSAIASHEPRATSHAPRPVRLGVIGCGGRMCGSVRYGILNSLCANCEIVCACDPDPRRRVHLQAVVKFRQPGVDAVQIPFYRDWREMLDKEAGRLDAVAIATPNHHHAAAAIRAMKRGLHVYVEKPMALTVDEVARMHAVQRETGVVAQVGNHGHSEEGMRVLVECIRAGMLGQVHDVWCFDDRLNALLVKPPAAPPPAGMDWDVWCGPAAVCDYYAPNADHGGLHPHDWHAWIGYGNGSIGNMGTHIVDPAFWALDLGRTPPTSVVANEAEWGCAGSWTWRTQIDWRFPARPGFDAVTLHWHDGVNAGVPYDAAHVDRIGICRKRDYQNLPPIVRELEARHGVDLGALGAIFAGEKGAIKIGPHGNALVFLPKNLKHDFGPVPKLFPREKGMDHPTDWIRAIRNPARPCGCNFDYSAPLATTVLLGNAAAQAGAKKKLVWDGKRFTNDAAANRFLAATYRKGWELDA